MTAVTASRGRTFLGWSPRLTSVLLLLVGIMVSVPWWVSSSVLYRVGVFVTSALLALSLNLIFGYTGMISFGHGALFAVGAYASGILLRGGYDWGIAAFGGIALGVAAGLVFGVIALRASGIYFAVLTLALGEIVFRVVLHWTPVTGGENGLPGVRPGTFLGFDLGGAWRYYYFMLGLALLVTAAMRLLTISRFGRTLRSIKSNPARAAYLGVNVRRHQLLSFSISSGVAAFAGVLYGPWSGILTPELARWTHSAEPILATLLGGAGNFLGPVVGAGVFDYLTYLGRDLQSIRIVVTGVVLLVVILVVPGGLTNLASRWFNRPPAGERDPADPIDAPSEESRA